MKRIAVAHMKGGVGKTTAAVTLAHLASTAGYRTLLVDMDAQGGAGYILRVDPGDGAKAKTVVRAGKKIGDSIFATEYPLLDIFPASLSFRKLPQLLAQEKNGSDRVGEMFKRAGKGYQVVVIDAPAGLSYESESILQAADLILAPIVPSPLAMESFGLLRGFLAKHGGRKSRSARLRGFYSMVDRRRKLHKETVDSLEYPPQIWPVVVPYASSVERMTIERLPLAAVRRAGPALNAYRELWRRTADHLGLSDSGLVRSRNNRPRLHGDR